MYQRVVLAYDGSTEGALALREGALLAKESGARVFILSIVPQSGGVRMAENIHGGAAAERMDAYRALLERGIGRLKALGLDPLGRLVMGEPVQEIARFAKEVGADLVVVGHRRRTMLERWWSGPAGVYLSDHLACSLLIARNRVSDEAFEAQLTATGGPA